MPVYCVFLPEMDRNDRELAEVPVFVPDKFSWIAFYCPPIWCIWSRCWLGFFVWALGAAAIFGIAVWLQISMLVMLAMITLLSLAFALEASVFIQGSLARRGLKLVDCIVAPDREQAERSFFARWPRAQNRPASARASSAMPPLSETPVFAIGLFPDERRRP